jgi:hypothetical protein
VVLSYWHKTKCHSSLDSALHKIAWYNLESLATKKIPECAKDLGREQENDEDTGKKRFAPEQGQPFKIF